MFNTAAEVIREFEGTFGFAKFCDVVPSVVTSWLKRGSIACKYFSLVREELIRRGFSFKIEDLELAFNFKRRPLIL